MPNEPKWTPGPWSVKPYGDWFDVVGPDGEEVLLGSAPRTLHPEPADIERQSANATLATQVPAMYILLDKIREYLIQHGLFLWLQYDADSWQPLIQTIGQVLSEARGEIIRFGETQRDQSILAPEALSRYSTCENCWQFPDWAPGAGYRCKCTACGRFVGTLNVSTPDRGESPDAK